VRQKAVNVFVIKKREEGAGRMNLCWTVLTDGRKEYIEQCLPDWISWLDKTIDNKFIVDDSGDTEYRMWLSNTFPSFKIIPVSKDRSGYSLAMNKVLSTVRLSKNRYCLHTEDDFLLKRKFNIEDAINVLNNNINLSQISFMRYPWYHNEIECGGLIQAIERDNVDAIFEQKNTNGIDWIQHKSYWTCNPNIFPRWLTSYKWPSGDWSESRFSRQIFRYGKVAGIMGSRLDEPYVEHIGRHRSGTKY